jgi:hypothetical protein
MKISYSLSVCGWKGRTYLGSTLSSHWPNGSVSLGCLNEDFIIALCIFNSSSQDLCKRDELRHLNSHKGWSCPATAWACWLSWISWHSCPSTIHSKMCTLRGYSVNKCENSYHASCVYSIKIARLNFGGRGRGRPFTGRVCNRSSLMYTFIVYRVYNKGLNNFARPKQKTTKVFPAPCCH